MSNLRIIGIILGILGFYLAFNIYRGPKWKRLNFILLGTFSLSLIIVSLNPGIVNSLANILSLHPEQRGRILALLIFSNIILWLFLFYHKSKLDFYKYQFDILVRNLGQDDLEDALKKSIKHKDIILVIPAYNEACSLKELANKIPTKIDDNEIGVIVVDDGSTDATRAVVENAGFLLAKNKTRRGGGAALRLGYDIARHFNPKVIVTMDADGQHSPEEIGVLVRPIIQDKSDFVIGSRIIGRSEKYNKFRHMGVFVFSFIINLLLGTKITDCSSGFRAFKPKLLDNVNLNEDQFHTSELIIEAARKNIRITEVPITITKRAYGSSKKGKDIIYGLNFAKTIFKTWWRRNG